jgi:HTH-type transcriptional regulator, sugar sensing transcriptional regulator
MTLDAILKALDLDELEANTYHLLLRYGSVTAGELTRKMGIPRSSLYGVLHRLCEHGLVGESLEQGTKTFTAEPPDKINLLFGKRIEQLTDYQQQFRKLLPELKKKNSSTALRPRLEMFEGAEGLQGVMKDMLLYYDLETFALWPIKNMLEVLSPEFFRYLNKERIKNNLYTRAIWPANHGVDLRTHPYLGVGPKFKREIRVAPEGIDFPMGYWSYGRKTAFISSQKESFGFLIDSEELSETLKVQFQALWKISIPVPVNEKDTAVFLKELERYTTTGRF